MIAIIDYDAGNLASVSKALELLGEEVIITRDKDELLKADKVILPGVGSYGDAMNKLHHYQLVEVIHEVIHKGTPFLGICLGMQLLFDGSDETPGVKGLSVFPGNVLRIPTNPNIKIPHMGWNSLEITPGATLYQGLPANPYVYFVHSYYLQAEEESIVAATTEYSTHIHASVGQEHVFGCQFHPEKSGDIGLAILRNFAAL